MKKIKICVPILAAAMLTACGAEKPSAEIETTTAAAVTETSETVSGNEIIAETTTATAVESGTDYIKAYTEHLNNMDMYITGIYLADINDDGVPEAVVEQNFGVFTDILYMNEKGMRTLSLEAVSMWGCIVCMPEKNAVSFTPMVGHTEGTAGYIEQYLYEWDGAEYVLTTTLLGRENEGVYTGEINGEEADSAAFEAAVKEQSYDYEENIWITGKLIRLGDEGFEDYITENFPGFDNWDIIWEGEE